MKWIRLIVQLLGPAGGPCFTTVTSVINGCGSLYSCWGLQGVPASPQLHLSLLAVVPVQLAAWKHMPSSFMQVTASTACRDQHCWCQGVHKPQQIAVLQSTLGWSVSSMSEWVSECTSSRKVTEQALMLCVRVLGMCQVCGWTRWTVCQTLGRMRSTL